MTPNIKGKQQSKKKKKKSKHKCMTNDSTSETNDVLTHEILEHNYYNILDLTTLLVNLHVDTILSLKYNVSPIHITKDISNFLTKSAQIGLSQICHNLNN